MMIQKRPVFLCVCVASICSITHSLNIPETSDSFSIQTITDKQKKSHLAKTFIDSMSFQIQQEI